MRPTAGLLWLVLPALSTALANPYPEAKPAARPGDDGTYYPFSGAVYVENKNEDLSAAQGKVCPAHNPISCDSIGASDYCCPSDNECAWSDNKEVGCCPHGHKCSGSISGAGSYQPTSHYEQPKQTTVYQEPPAKTVYAQGGHHDDGKYDDGHYDDGHNKDDYRHTPDKDYDDGNYCSTLVGTGPGLPRTAAADCGTILIVEPAEAARIALGWVRLGVMVVGLQALGGLLLGAHALR